MLLQLPLDVLLLLCLEQRSLARLACCSREARQVADRMLCFCGLKIRERRCPVLLQPRWTNLVSLSLTGVPMRYDRHGHDIPPGSSTPDLPLLVLPRLRRLVMRHCRLPGSGRHFWGPLFEGCPVLEEVTFCQDFCMPSYGPSVDHLRELITLGAPRLTRLDVEGNWLVMYPTRRHTEYNQARAATMRAYAVPPVQSSTLRAFRSVCQQVPIGVDAPLDTLTISEPVEAPFVASKLGPATLRHTRDLVYTAAWPGFDAARLSGFQALHTAEVSIMGTNDAHRVSECLATLAHLPVSLRRLKLRLDVWHMRLHTSRIEWGQPLRHLDNLEELVVQMRFPPNTVDQLLACWMGVPPGISRVTLCFQEPINLAYHEEMMRLFEEEEVDSEDDTIVELKHDWAAAMRPIGRLGELLDCLEMHPGATLTHNLPQLVFDHPRVVYDQS